MCVKMSSVVINLFMFRPNLLVNACDGRSVLDGQTARPQFEWQPVEDKM